MAGSCGRGLASGAALFQQRCSVPAVFALDLKNGSGKEEGALRAQQSGPGLDIFGSVSLHIDLLWSAIRVFPVSTQDKAEL